MTWRPTGTTWCDTHRPKLGSLVPFKHAVWRVVAIEDVGMNEDDIEVWSQPWRKQPDVATWDLRPFRIHWQYVGGVKPERMRGDGRASSVVRARSSRSWDYYRNDRWPQCSCCGEPMPCTSELTDRIVDHDLKRINEMQSRMPGSCWGCGDPITQRQRAIRYVGDNIDLPGGLPVVFHLRKDCYMSAVRYEERWLAADHSRRRILTYPLCGGALVTHKGEVNECVGDDRDPECRGVLTHDHRYFTVCWGDKSADCPRGCPRPRTEAEIWGTGGRERRPTFRDPDLPQGQLPEKPVAFDRRIVCPGHLLVHQDGTSDCIAGGRDDCWGGEQFRHERKRDCRTQTHGCPKCEVAA